MSAGDELSLQIKLMGGFDVRVGDRVVEESAWQRRHARQLVKLLASSRGQQLHRDQLIESLWPESARTNGSNNLNKVLFMARRALEPELGKGPESRYLIRQQDHLILCLQDERDIDVFAFEVLAEEGLSTGDPSILAAAAALYTGEFLPDDLYDDSFVSLRERLSRLYREVLEAWLSSLERSENRTSCIRVAHKLIELDPINEKYHRKLMRYYVLQSQRSQALEQYERCCDALSSTLGSEPDKATRELFNEIRNNSANEILTAQVPHLAVLPFVNVSDDNALDYLCEGLTEDLIKNISRLSDYRVMARSVVYRWTEKAGFDIDPLRQEHGVNLVISGRLKRHGKRLHVWVELVNTQDKSLLWADFVDFMNDEYAAVQRQLTTSLFAALGHKNTKNKQVIKPGYESTSVEAYHEYLKGRHFWNKRSSDSIFVARRHFSAAIDSDPLFASAYAGLADCYNLLSLYGDAEPRSTMPKARAAALKALQIDHSIAEPYASLAYYEMSYTWQFDEAERQVRMALDRDPDYALCWQWHHKLLIAAGRFDEAKNSIERASVLDPLSMMIVTEAAWGNYYAHQYEKSLSLAESAIQDAPEFAMAHYVRGISALQLLQFDKAFGSLETALNLQDRELPFMLALGAIGHVYALTGQINKAERAISSLKSLPGAGRSYANAVILVALGRYSEAITELRAACNERYDRVVFLPHEPLFDVLREDPEYLSLQSHLHNPPDFIFR